MPIYFKLIPSVSAFVIVAHRIAWSLPFLAVLILVSRGWRKFAPIVRNPRTLGVLLVSAVLIGVNWVLYTWSVVSGHILAASFGYYLNPLANVLLGRFVLGERLSKLQWTAVAIAGAGVVRGSFPGTKRRSTSTAKVALRASVAWPALPPALIAT